MFSVNQSINLRQATSNENGWYSLSVEEVLKKLGSGKEGLTEALAKERLNRYGPNELPKKKRLSWIKILFSQFKNPLVYILLIAALVTLALQEFIDMGVILAAVLINVIVGFVQENKAEGALIKLREIITLKATVVRDGHEKEIEAREVVPGDIIVTRAGTKAPADARIISSNELKINEASLTGESLPVSKEHRALKEPKELAEQENMIFMSTVVTGGLGKAVVTETGIATAVGQIAELLRRGEEPKTPLQKKLERFSKILGIVIIVIALALLGLGIALGRPFEQMFTTAVAVAVAAIPEGLVIGVTAILAIGMQRILKRKGLVRKLVAAETLGSTTIICSDKTGTITEGKMKLTKVVTPEGEFVLDHTLEDHSKEREQVRFALEIALLCNDAHIENPEESPELWRMAGSPTERSLMLGAMQAGLARGELKKQQPLIDQVPFSSERKFRITHHHKDGKSVFYLVGAPEVVIDFSQKILVRGERHDLREKRQEDLRRTLESLSKKGYRVLASAFREFSEKKKTIEDVKDRYEKFCFVSFLILEDPLREGVKETIQQINNAGIKTIMITGDHRLTARHVAGELGLRAEKENVLEGKDLLDLSEEEFAKKVEEIDVYARVSPLDKLRIIRAWQERGAVVAMTGDGVNDAPALQKADIGVAVGSGTDVAKEASDLVVLDDNFKTIAAAVEQGRVIYDNIKKVILYLLSDSFSEVLLIISSLILGAFMDFPLPLLAVQILWINLITDGFPNIALTLEPEEKEIMKEPPQKRQKSILDSERKFLIFLISAVTGLGNLLIFYLFWKASGDIALARTVAFASLGVDSLLYVFSCRSLRKPIWKFSPFSNYWLIGAVLAGAVLQLAAIYLAPLQTVLRTVPLGLLEWEIILAMSALIIVLIELTKWTYFRKHQITSTKLQTNSKSQIQNKF